MVVATVIVVVAFMLPSLSRARTSGYQTECTNHLRQLAVSLTSYADDYGMYPFEDPLISTLHTAGYLTSPGEFECPLDLSNAGDTYSMGYLGYHPRNGSATSPLVVCGWHGRFGTLATFVNGNVGKLESVSGRQLMPVTVFHGNSGVQPGFALHANDPLIVNSDTGNQAFVTGTNGASFLSAAYDPVGNDGNGLFVIAVTYDSQSASKQKVIGQSATPVLFQAKFEYVTLELTSDPTQNETRVIWKPKDGFNKVILKKYLGFRITHRVTGESEESTTPGDKRVYKPDATALAYDPDDPGTE